MVRSRCRADLHRDPRIAVVVDSGGSGSGSGSSGEEYGQLRGVEPSGTVRPVGEAPRIGEPCPELDTPERRFAAKNFGLGAMPHDGRHA